MKDPMKLKSMDGTPDRVIISIKDAINALADLGFTGTDARLFPPCPDDDHSISIFSYHAFTNKLEYSRPLLDRSPDPKSLQTLLQEMFNPFLVTNKSVITVHQFPSEAFYHQQLTMLFQ